MPKINNGLTYVIRDGKVKLAKCIVEYYDEKLQPLLEECVDEEEALKFVESLSDEIKERSYMIHNSNYTSDVLELESVLSEVSEEEAVELLTKEVLLPQILDSINNSCSQMINAGITLETSKGDKHFSSKLEDQTNLTFLMSELEKAAQGQDSIINLEKGVPYHADGEACGFYSVDDFKKIVTAVLSNILYHQTYTSHLKDYIKTLSADELQKVEYGMPLPDEIQNGINELLGG